MLAKIRKGTDARSQANSGGWEELPKERTARSTASMGKNTRQRLGGGEGGAARAGRATFLVRLEIGRLEISLSGSCPAPGKRGRLFTSMRKGRTVTARYVTA